MRLVSPYTRQAQHLENTHEQFHFPAEFPEIRRHRALAAGGQDVPVHFTRDIGPAGLLKAYDGVMQGRKPPGKVAVKLLSGEPVALDKACVDLIYAADPAKSASQRERMESRHGIRTLDHA